MHRLIIAKLAAAAILAAGIPASALAAKVSAAGFSVACTIAAGSTSGTVTIATVPAGKELQVQTSSYYTFGQASGSIGQVYLGTTAGGAGGYIAVPEALADGSIYPGATLAATFYADPGSRLFANCYRSGSTASSESMEITIAGNYVNP